MRGIRLFLAVVIGETLVIVLIGGILNFWG